MWVKVIALESQYYINLSKIKLTNSTFYVFLNFVP